KRPTGVVAAFRTPRQLNPDGLDSLSGKGRPDGTRIKEPQSTVIAECGRPTSRVPLINVVRPPFVGGFVGADSGRGPALGDRLRFRRRGSGASPAKVEPVPDDASARRARVLCGAFWRGESVPVTPDDACPGAPNTISGTPAFNVDHVEAGSPLCHDASSVRVPHFAIL